MTFIDVLESVIEIVSDTAVRQITSVTQALSPDGRGFGQVFQSEDEDIADYMKLRGNPMAWADYIFNGVQQIEQKLSESALSPDAIASVHPFDIAQKAAIVYSSEMEQKLKKSHGLIQDRLGPVAQQPGHSLFDLAMIR